MITHTHTHARTSPQDDLRGAAILHPYVPPPPPPSPPPLDAAAPPDAAPAPAAEAGGGEEKKAGAVTGDVDPCDSEVEMRCAGG